LYLRGQIYLRYPKPSQAVLPQAAFAVLKYGLNANTLTFFGLLKKGSAGNLLNFIQYTFTASNTLGIPLRVLAMPG
jgi:hypothetical protein